MLELKPDESRPDRFHLWSHEQDRYLLRSVTLGRIRQHIRVNAIEEADALLDKQLDDLIKPRNGATVH